MANSDDYKSSKPKRLTYMLDQVFSEMEDISLASLSGRDQLRVRNLSDAAESHGVCVYLAHFEHSRYGECDPGEDDEYENADNQVHDFYDDYTSSWRLSTLYTLEGAKLGGGFPLSEDDFIADVASEFEEPDEEDYQGWGYDDKSVSTTHFFPTKLRSLAASEGKKGTSLSRCCSSCR